MNYNQEISMGINANKDYENRTGLNSEDLILLLAAKGGDNKACGKLYMNHTQEVERMHLYGPDGKHPKKFGFTYSRKGASYEEASGYCYLCFYNCVHSYDVNSGTPFMAWVRGIFAKRGQDWVEDRNPDNFLFKGDRISESGETLGDDGSCVPETFSEGRYIGDKDLENASVDVFRVDHEVASLDESDVFNIEGLEQVRNYLRKVGEDKLEKFVSTWISLGDTKKNPISAVAERLGVRRQTAYNYMDSVQALVKGHFGNHFYGRD